MTAKLAAAEKQLQEKDKECNKLRDKLGQNTTTPRISLQNTSEQISKLHAHETAAHALYGNDEGGGESGYGLYPQKSSGSVPDIEHLLDIKQLLNNGRLRGLMPSPKTSHHELKVCMLLNRLTT